MPGTRLNAVVSDSKESPVPREGGGGKFDCRFLGNREDSLQDDMASGLAKRRPRQSSVSSQLGHRGSTKQSGDGMRQAWQCLEKIRRDVDELEKVAQLFTEGMAFQSETTMVAMA